MNHFTTNATYKAAVTKYPSGKFGLIGSIPAHLMIEATNSIGQKYMKSPIFTTRIAAEKALANA